jgi:hypothetical protein
MKKGPDNMLLDFDAAYIFSPDLKVETEHGYMGMGYNYIHNKLEELENMGWLPPKS